MNAIENVVIKHCGVWSRSSDVQRHVKRSVNESYWTGENAKNAKGTYMRCYTCSYILVIKCYLK